MKYSDIAKLSTRAFKTNPSRTWLTILGMGVGTGSVVMLVGLGFGLQKIILEEIVFGESLLSLDVSTLSTSAAIKLDRNVVEMIKAKEDVLDVAPLASFPALVTFEGLTGSIFIDGVSPAYMRYAGTQALEGELFIDGQEASDSDKVVFAPSALQLFGIEDPAEAIGKTVSFRLLVPSRDDPTVTNEVRVERRYVIKGVSKDEASISAMMLMSELEKHVAITEYGRARVRVVDNQVLDPVTDDLIEMGFNVVALSKTVDQATKIFQGIQAVLAAFGGVALVVSAIGMFNTMTVTLLERTSEIGIMRTIGASQFDIKILFLSEATIVGFLGGIVGILIGLFIGISLNVILNFVASQFGGTAVALFHFPFTFLLFISIFSGVVGFMTGVFPAKRASSLDPLDAIRD
jgi:putative ABC transport system permease protein